MTTKDDNRRAPGLTASAEAILESISDGVFTVDDQWRITSFNRAAEEITGIPRAEAIGRLCSEALRSSMCEAECALRRTLESGRPVVGEACYLVTAAGDRLPVSVSTAVLRDESGRVVGGAETFRDLSELEALRSELEERAAVGGLTSRSPAMRKVFAMLPVVADSDSTVLITGETGTGKELAARTIHSLSPRGEGPFVAVNCGALPDSLLESELFGHKAGAFTDARADKPGRFARARGGSLFLDEIGEVTPALQVRLLRVLQERVYEPLGGVEPEQADVRIIAATNRDLAEAVRRGDFREDLFYRINVVRMDLPPLRRRREDIPLLVDQFVERFNRTQGKSVSGIEPEALSLLMAHDWPGNIRELENVIERAFVLVSQGAIGVQHLPDEMTRTPETDEPARELRTARQTVEAVAIRDALERNGFNRLEAARDLGIHKSTLFRKMKRLGLEFPERDGRSGESAVEESR